jgi:hypothetical protein
MTTITVAPDGGYPGFVIKADDGRTLFVQSDYDWPDIATTFGWWIGAIPVEGEDRPCPADHDGTDGTIDCPSCGTTAGYFIAAAGAYLTDNHLDFEPVEDPGYFIY